MLSPLGSEVMISCHVAFFRVICYNPVLHIKMMTTTPPGHVHEDFSTVIAEVMPAPAGRQKKTSTPLYRQEPPRLLASVALFTLSRPDLNTTVVTTLSLCSPLVTDPAGSSPPGKVRR